MRKLTIIAAMSVILATLSSEKSWSSSSKLEDIQNDIYLLIRKIHLSIEGTPLQKIATINKNSRDVFFFKPESIYDEKQQDNVGKNLPYLVGKLKDDERYILNPSVDEARKKIDKRRQYAEIIDKAVNLKIFEETENRFQQIALMVGDIKKTNNLKDLTELQLHMKLMRAALQNEATKLQMIARARNTEQIFINRLKRKRNIQILGSVNKQMPKIRSS